MGNELNGTRTHLVVAILGEGCDEGALGALQTGFGEEAWKGVSLPEYGAVLSDKGPWA